MCPGRTGFVATLAVAAAAALVSCPARAVEDEVDFAREFAGGIVPARWIASEEFPGHLMTSEHMLQPYYEPVASAVIEFKFSEKGLLGVLRSQRLAETIPASKCMQERDLIELLVYDHRQRKTYTAWRQVVEHSQRGQKRMVREWAFYSGGVIFEVSTPELRKPGQAGRCFSVYWKKSATSSAPAKLVATYDANEAELVLSGDETSPAVLFHQPREGKTGSIQVLDGSEPVPVPPDVKLALVFFTAGGKSLAVASVPGDGKGLRVDYLFDLKTRKFQPTGEDKTFKHFRPRKALLETDALKLAVEREEGKSESLFLVSKARLDPRESPRVRLYTGAALYKGIRAAFSPKGDLAAFTAPDTGDTCYLVYWILTPKWTDVYPRQHAWWAAHSIMRALDAYWHARDEAEGKDPWARQNSYELPPDPANALRPYVKDFPGVLDRFVFTSGPVDGIKGEYVGYYEEARGFRGYIEKTGSISAEPVGCQPPDVVGAGAEAFDQY